MAKRTTRDELIEQIEQAAKSADSHEGGVWTHIGGLADIIDMGLKALAPAIRKIAVDVPYRIREETWRGSRTVRKGTRKGVQIGENILTGGKFYADRQGRVFALSAKGTWLEENGSESTSHWVDYDVLHWDTIAVALIGAFRAAGDQDAIDLILTITDHGSRYSFENSRDVIHAAAGDLAAKERALLADLRRAEECRDSWRNARPTDSQSAEYIAQRVAQEEELVTVMKANIPIIMASAAKQNCPKE